ncbi:LTA synthase family protein [Caldibacillus debilis]|uniref:LTA synthase family protein n=1 Tax=Caldibacillus debilis TaxID=301148 RepID=UPI000B54DC0E|nr:LTA synthase family protein [Caldibacillus debilis]OUM89767.1 MAG: glycerol phosphate lipoteichoic acid synthase [Caldibacillus debilis]
MIGKAKRNLSTATGFFLLAVVLLWLKTYVIQLTQFELGTEKAIQKFLLFLNPLGSSLLFLSFALFLSGRKKYAGILFIDLVLSVLLYANVVYYRFFSDFITFPTMFQTQNFGDLGTSVLSLMYPSDILFFSDFILLAAVFASRYKKLDASRIARRKVAALLIFALGVISFNIGLAEADRPQLLTRGFDRHYIVKYLGMYNYVLYDAVQSTRSTAEKALADSSDVTEVLNFTRSHYAKPNPEYFGVAKGMNVIYFHLESIQQFLINYRLNGEEVTPFLNSLIRDKNTIYFDNFYHQTAQGKTADAEFMIENSLFGLPQGAAFTTKGLNTYHAAPAILSQLGGYTTAVFHGNNGTFWNRDEIYKSFGYEKFFDADYYQMDPENTAEYGLMDKPFFAQSIPYLESLPEPFYVKFITVSNHYPYLIDEKDATIPPHHTGDKSVDRYFQTARYADEALKEFFDYLKESGLYDRSVIIMYGDHYGISENHKEAMEKVLGKEIDALENAKLQRVPLIIRIPGVKGGVNHTYGGQIDLLPTLLHLLGIDSKDYIHFGTDLLSKDHDQVVPFRNGDFVSPTISYIHGKFYDTQTGMELPEDRIDEAKEYLKLVEKKLSLSDKVVNGDLLRFYTPKNFKPVDRSKYDYNRHEETVNH